jgi:hypothetical protein
MSFESTVLGYLTANSGVTDLCPDARIFFNNVSRKITAPFIFAQRVSTNPANTFDQGQGKASRLDNVQLQVTSYSRTLDASLALSAAIRVCMEALVAPRCMMTDQRPGYDDFTDLHGQIMTFSCWYNAATGATAPIAPSVPQQFHSFETVAQNHAGYNIVSTAYTEGVSLVKTFATDTGATIISTLLFNFSTGLPATKTLSGTGLPPGIATVCTYDFTGRDIPLKTYT